MGLDSLDIETLVLRQSRAQCHTSSLVSYYRDHRFTRHTYGGRGESVKVGWCRRRYRRRPFDSDQDLTALENHFIRYPVPPEDLIDQAWLLLDVATIGRIVLKKDAAHFSSKDIDLKWEQLRDFMKDARDRWRTGERNQRALAYFEL